MGHSIKPAMRPATPKRATWKIERVADPYSGEPLNTYRATSHLGHVLTVLAETDEKALEIAMRRPITNLDAPTEPAHN
jgi:hypothetical protein